MTELAEAADAVIAPVRFGFLRPLPADAHADAAASVSASMSVSRGGAPPSYTSSAQGGDASIRDPTHVFSPYILGFPPSEFTGRQTALSSMSDVDSDPGAASGARVGGSSSSRTASQLESGRAYSFRGSADSHGGLTSGGGGGANGGGGGRGVGENGDHVDAAFPWAMQGYLDEQVAKAAAKASGAASARSSRRMASVHLSSGRGDGGSSAGAGPTESSQFTAEQLARVFSRLIKAAVDVVLNYHSG